MTIRRDDASPSNALVITVNRNRSITPAMAEVSTIPREKKLMRTERKVLRSLQILEAAFEEFVENGYSAARVEDIAGRIGVTKGTVYVYFETKEHLFKAMCEHILASFQEALKNHPRTGGPVEELKSFLEFLFDRFVDDRKMRELFRFVIAEGPRFPELIDRYRDVFIEPVFAKIASILEDGVAKKKFRATAPEFAKVVVLPSSGILIFRLIFDSRRTLNKTAVLRSYLELILRGLLI